MAHRKNSVADQIAEFAAGIAPGSIPTRVREQAERHLLDGLATMVGGAAEASSRILRRYFRACKSPAEATVPGTAVRLSCEHAALVNGVHAHVLDYDDAQGTSDRMRPLGQQTHPTSPILSAVLALAEMRRDSGTELLVAYIAGVEVACRLGDAVDPSHYLAGFHPTGTLGVFGAAVGCARLLKLEPKAIRRALGIAATLSSGLRANRGTMAKGLNAGNAARNGLLAANLAACGFTASEKIFEMPMGFFGALCPGGVKRSLLRFGEPFFFEKPGIAIKLYPCAGVLHPGLDAVLALRARHRIRAAAIKRVRVSLDARAALPLVFDDPHDALESKFSVPFAFAVALIDGAAGLEQFSDSRVRDRRVRDLMRRVELVVRRSRSKTAAGTGNDTEVEIEMGGGVHRARASVARGQPSRPATRADIEEKFRQCAVAALRQSAIEKFLRDFSTLRHARSLAAWLRPLRVSAIR